MDKLHCMVDLETMGTDPTTHVLSIGAVLFSPGKRAISTEEDHRYYVAMGPYPQTGRTFNIKTVMWWMEQSVEAREAACPRIGSRLGPAVHGFLAWLALRRPAYVWANDPDFDVAILQDCALRTLGMGPEDWPVAYNATRSFRTLCHNAWGAEYGEYIRAEFPRTKGVAHNALADAEWQAQVAIAAMGLTGFHD